MSISIPNTVPVTFLPISLNSLSLFVCISHKQTTPQLMMPSHNFYTYLVAILIVMYVVLPAVVVFWYGICLCDSNSNTIYGEEQSIIKKIIILGTISWIRFSVFSCIIIQFLDLLLLHCSPRFSSGLLHTCKFDASHCPRAIKMRTRSKIRK